MIYFSVSIVVLLLVSILASGIRIAKTIGRRDIPAASPSAAFKLAQVSSRKDSPDSQNAVDGIEQLISDLIVHTNSASTVTRHYYSKTFNSPELGLDVEDLLKSTRVGGSFSSEPTAYKIPSKMPSKAMEAAKVYNFQDYKKEAQK